jgi:hypothetical protein
MNLDERRKLALDYLNIATKGAEGRTEGDSVYIAITEARDSGKSYSSCGDLPHWLLYRLGVRCSYVNRAEHNDWRSGQNISALAFGCAVARVPKSGESYDVGDILLIWNNETGTDAHALVVRKHAGVELQTAEYGQPGGAQCRRTFVAGKIGTRKLQRVIRLEDVLRHAEQSGKLVEPQPLESWLASAEPSVSSHPVVKRGSKSAYVMKAQAALKIMIDGEFGNGTENAVKRAQSNAGLPATGIVDTATWAALLHKVPR